MTEIARREGGQVAVADEPTPQQQLLVRLRRDDFKEQLAMALPPTVTADKFVRVAATALMEKPEIALAEPTSILTSLLRCAQLGLLPDGHEAAINVYRSKTKDANGRDVWVDKAQLLPMIHGYAKIAANYGWTLTARVVYSADEFEYEQGLEQKLRHIPARPGVDRGHRTAVYAIARKRAHDPIVRVLDASDVERAKASAKTDKIWNTHTDRMWEKTAGKLLVKNDLPKGDLDERVLKLIEAAESDPADAAAALYGPQARAALASGETVNTETGEIQATPRDGAEDVAGASSDDAGHRTLGGTTGAVSGGDAEQDGGGSRDVAAAGSSDETTGEGSVAAAVDAEPSNGVAAALDRTDAAAEQLSAAAASSGEADPDDIAFGDDDELPLDASSALSQAAAAVVPKGNPPTHPDRPGARGLTLAQIDERPDAARWFQLALGKDPAYWGDPDFALKLRVFVEARRPDLLTAAA